MAEIATYRCSNPLCGLILRLVHEFPLWHESAPKALRSPRVHPASKAYVVRYRSGSFCIRCKKIVEYTEVGACSLCDSKVHTEQIGRTCPRCSKGNLVMPLLVVY